MNLAFRLRPTTFDEFVGQTHLTGQAGIVKKIIKSNASFSLIFWGPPGSGKTTLANIIASEINADFHAISAVEAGKADLNKIVLILLFKFFFPALIILFKSAFPASTAEIA